METDIAASVGECGVLRRVYAAAVQTFHNHLVFTILVLLYASAMLLAAHLYNVEHRVRLSFYSVDLMTMLLMFGGVYCVMHVAYMLAKVRPEHPLQFAVQEIRHNCLQRERLVNALPVVLLLPVFMSSFTSFKIMLPEINPFSWDELFAAWDRQIHAGSQPWQWLHPVFGYPVMTTVVNFFYNSWFFVMFSVVLWQAFTLRRPVLRMRFLLTFVLLWILLGTVGAIVLSSAGPCYYGRLVDGPDIYRPLMEYLRSADTHCPVWALDAQQMLWESYTNEKAHEVAGISAMPSMHVSMVVLFALIGWKTNRRAGLSLTIYALIILIGCVHLAWHYAIDAYLAIVLTCLIWWIVGKMQKRYAPQPQVKD